MNEPFPLAPYRQALAELTPAIYETMLHLGVKEVSTPGDLPQGAFTGAVYYSGDWHGALLVECGQQQALDWAGRYLSLVETGLEDARDCLGELTNVIAGNLKPLLPSSVAVSLPSVVQGNDYSLKLCGGNLSETILFADPLGPFRITLVEVVPCRG